MKKPLTVMITKGGPGSGHRGHSGRPGKRGGSLPGKGYGNFQPGTAYSTGEAFNSGELSEDNSYQSHNAVIPMYHSKAASDILNTAMGDEDIYVPEGKVTAKWAYAGDEVRSKLKDKIVSEVAEETEIPYPVVNMFIGAWATTSNKGILQASLQETAEELFGIQSSDWQKQWREKSVAELDEMVKKDFRWFLVQTEDDYPETEGIVEKYKDVVNGAKDLEKIPAEYRQPFMDSFLLYYKETGLAIRKDWQKKILRSIYNRTQKLFADHGYSPDDSIILFRGMNMTNRPGITEMYTSGVYRGNVLESWSASWTVAKMFGEDIITMKVPIKNIISTALTGWGCYTEGEFVVFGNVGEDNEVVVLTDRDIKTGELIEY